MAVNFAEFLSVLAVSRVIGGTGTFAFSVMWYKGISASNRTDVLAPAKLLSKVFSVSALPRNAVGADAFASIFTLL